MISLSEAKKCVEEVKECGRVQGMGQKMLAMYHNHVYGVAHVAEKMAEKTGIVEPERAFVFGLCHDIGRFREQSEHRFHGVLGYEYFKEADEDLARVCLTHMFPLNKIDDYEKIKYFFFDKPEDYGLIKGFLEKNKIDETDMMMQFADCLVNAYGVVTIEERNAEYTKRHGYSIPQKALDDMFSLKRYFDERLGSDAYRLLGEINMDWRLPLEEERDIKRQVLNGNTSSGR